MTVVGIICGSMLGVAAVLALVRMTRGPSLLDRVVCMDMMVAIIAGGIGVMAAVNRNSSLVPVLLVVSLLGFVGSVGVARFVARAYSDHPPGPPVGPEPTADTDTGPGNERGVSGGLP